MKALKVNRLTNKEKSILAYTGAPRDRFNFQSFIPKPKLGDVKIDDNTITALHQVNKMRPFIEGEDQLDGYNYLAARENDQVAVKVALRLAANEPGTVMWERLRGGFSSSNMFARYEDKTPDLLVVSGIYANSTAPVFEKARDLLNEVRCRKIIIVVGDEPTHFAWNLLYTPIHRFMYFAPQRNATPRNTPRTTVSI